MEVEKTHNKTCRNGVWTKQSEEALEKAEKNILSYLKTPYKLYYVPIQTPRAKDKIWTLSMNEDSTHIPLVLIHGMAAGLALWCPNLDELAASRPVYAIDLLGFGRSSRPKFPTDPEKVVAQWVASLEEWRVAVGLNQFILLGHSLGGYISTSYAISYPERVRHLILADPWGFQEIPKDMEEEKNKLPLWRRAVASLLLSFNPLWPIRAAGPAGEWLVRTVRADVPKKFANYLPDAKKVIPEYIYQCNVQRPSGESGFQALVTGLAWPKNPMIRHVHNLHPALPVTMLYGSESWIPNVGELVREKRGPKAKTYVEVVIGASHHIYIDRPEVFDGFVLDACSMADQHDPRPDMVLYTHVPEPVYVEPQAVIVSA